MPGQIFIRGSGQKDVHEVLSQLIFPMFQVEVVGGEWWQVRGLLAAQSGILPHTLFD